MEEEDIKWLCDLARSGCQNSMTEERADKKTERVNKIEKQLLHKRGGDDENKQ